MKISLPNSRRCSIAETLLPGLLLLLAQASVSFAAPVPARESLKDQIDRYRASSFDSLLGQWSKTYGSGAVQPLLSIVEDHKASDRTRYIALMGAAKLGGSPAATLIAPHLKDKSWMIRSASLRALSALNNPETSTSILPLLQDPALVVRVEAVNAVQQLKPSGAPQALVEALKSKENYRLGKAQWLPQRALNALLTVGDASMAPKLAFLLDHKTDPDLQRQTIYVLENLTGQKVDHKQPLQRQIAEWKKKLSSG